MHVLLVLSKSSASAGLDISEWVILICGVVLVIGIFGEYKKVPKRMALWPESILALLVMIGVAGELLGDGGVFLFSRRLQILEGADIQMLSEVARTALNNASCANDTAKFASDASNTAAADAPHNTSPTAPLQPVWGPHPLRLLQGFALVVSPKSEY
jgi:hypothetical protein